MIKSAVIVIGGAFVVAAVPNWVKDIGIYAGVITGVITAVSLIWRHLRGGALYVKHDLVQDVREALSPELLGISKRLEEIEFRVIELEDQFVQGDGP